MYLLLVVKCKTFLVKPLSRCWNCAQYLLGARGESALEALLKKNKCLLHIKVECQANCW